MLIIRAKGGGNMSGISKTDKELATELTIAVIKAKADIISSIDANMVKDNKVKEWLNDSQITQTFNKIYATITEKTY